MAPKTLLIGIDAAGWSYLDPLLQEGRLPNLARLLEQGAHGNLQSVMPPITPAAWSSIVTGVNPGKHGIFEWVKTQADEYRVQPVRSYDRAGTTIWQRLNEHGIRTGIINIPLTYPTQPVDGFTICGFSAPASSRDLTYPHNLLDEIEKAFGTYHPDVRGNKKKQTFEQIYQTERDHQAHLVRIAAHFAKTYNIQVLVMNLMLLDHANHLVPDMQMVNQAIIDSDQHLGFLLEEFSPDNVMVISDHGSRRVKGVFMLNAWLAEQGYLKRSTRAKKEQSQILNYLLAQKENGDGHLVNRTWRRIVRETYLHLPQNLFASTLSKLENDIPLATLQIQSTDQITPEETRVYLPGGHRGNLSINQMGRETNGFVRPDERDSLLTELQQKLTGIQDPETGEPVFKKVYRAEELYEGPFTNLAPDLICDYYESRWSIITKIHGLNSRPWRYFISGDRWFGDHSPTGVYIFAGTGFQKVNPRGNASLLDIAPTLLYLYGIAQPQDYDGMPLFETLQPDYVTAHPLSFQPGDDRIAQNGQQAGAQEDNEEVVRRLSALGYLD